MSRKYFGTDGIRGAVGSLHMNAAFALKLGWAAGRALTGSDGARVLIGKDTRRSGYMFESALEAGLSSAGVDVDLLGPLPTPGVAYLTRALRADAGIVISASHNPHHDNGFKFFGADGYKLSDAIELQIEKLLDSEPQTVEASRLGSARRIDDANGRYIEFCKSTFPAQRNLNGMRLVLDCAQGAAYRVAPAVFEELGAEVAVIGNTPDGLNINQDCGSTHLQALAAAVQAQGADLGVAFDGDADRCLMVGPDGATLDGDDLLYIIARHRADNGRLRGPVVGTLMSNLGLEQALQQMGSKLLRAKVGDRHVLELLKQHDAELGGESSGHTICLDLSTAGDGVITALQVLAAMIQSGQGTVELTADLQKFPQVLINVKVSGSAQALIERGEIQVAASQAERALGGHGRLLLRASGTEPLVRVMVEAEDQAMADSVAQQLAAVVRECAATN